ncbi:MAG: hypothetical protein RLZZ70_720 [Candidatus Parcubacteria bacterium]|jgi:hypothetical protein
MFANSLNLLGQAVKATAYLDGAMKLIGVVKGTTSLADLDDKAGPVSQGLTGIFGKGDEREIQIHLQELDDAEREHIAGFMNYHFKGDGLQDQLLTMWFASSFRTFVAKFEASKNPVKVTKATAKDGEAEVTTEGREYAKDPAVGFLKLMVKIMKKGEVEYDEKKYKRPSEAKRREWGYEKLITYFEAFGIPRKPPKMKEDYIKWATALGLKSWEAVRTMYQGGRQALQEAYGEEMRQMLHPKNWRERMLNRLLKLVTFGS